MEGGEAQRLWIELLPIWHGWRINGLEGCTGEFVRFILTGLAVACAIAQPAWADIGRVKVASGKASVERGGKLLPVKPGFVIETGDTLVTGPGGRAGITFIDNTRLSAAPGTRMTFRVFDYNDTTQRGRFTSFLRKGVVAIISGRIARNDMQAMRVETPNNIYVIRRARVVLNVK